jgi:WD40 repeat protein
MSDTGISALDFAPDGRTLALAAGRRVLLWDLDAGAPGRVFPDVASVFAARFHPDGRHLAVGSGGGQIRTWDMAAPLSKPRIEGRHAGQVSGLSYAPDRRQLASCSRDGTLRLWDADTGDPVLVILAFFDGSSAAITPGGRVTPSSPGVEPELVYLVQETEGGRIQQLSHAQFRGRYASALGDDRGIVRPAPASGPVEPPPSRGARRP